MYPSMPLTTMFRPLLCTVLGCSPSRVGFDEREAVVRDADYYADCDRSRVQRLVRGAFTLRQIV